MDQRAMSKKSQEVVSKNNNSYKDMHKNKSIGLAADRKEKITIKICARRVTCQPESRL